MAGDVQRVPHQNGVAEGKLQFRRALEHDVFSVGIVGYGRNRNQQEDKNQNPQFHDGPRLEFRFRSSLPVSRPAPPASRRVSWSKSEESDILGGWFGDRQSNRAGGDADEEGSRAGLDRSDGSLADGAGPGDGQESDASQGGAEPIRS